MGVRGNKRDRVGVETVVGEGSQLDGTIVVADGIRVDGMVTGKLEVGGNLRIGRQGSVAADVECAKDVVVAGRVEGNLQCDGEIHLEATAIVIGDVSANGMAMEEGAVIKGLVSVGSDDALGTEERLRAAAGG